jgi:valyl-tRNA synthetase
VLRLLAPFLPFVTEEAWSWRQAGSVHQAAWPDPAGLLALADAAGTGPGGTAALDAAAAAIGAVRRAKSRARLPMKATVSQLILTAPQEQLDALAAAAPDVSAAGHVGEITLRPLAGIEAVHEVVL